MAPPAIVSGHGGQRPRSGRKHRDTVRVECAVPRQVYEELVLKEKLIGIYRTRVPPGFCASTCSAAWLTGS